MTLRLASLAAGDHAAFEALVAENERRFVDGGLAMLPRTPADFERWLATPSCAQSLRAVFGMWTRQAGGTERLAGFVGVEHLQRFQGAGVWYGVDPSVQGRGLAKTAVMRAMADFASCSVELGLGAPPRWVLHAMPRNTRSCQLASSMGFRRDEMLDYTRSTSSRGGTKFHGFISTRSAASLDQEAQARQMAASMRERIARGASNDEPAKTRRLRA